LGRACPGADAVCAGRTYGGHCGSKVHGSRRDGKRPCHLGTPSANPGLDLLRIDLLRSCGDGDDDRDVLAALLRQRHPDRRECIDTFTPKQEVVAAGVVVRSDKPNPRDPGLLQQRLDLTVVILQAPDQRGHLVPDRRAGALRRGVRVILVVAGDQLQLSAVDPTRAIDLVDRDLCADRDARERELRRADRAYRHQLDRRLAGRRRRAARSARGTRAVVAARGDTERTNNADSEYDKAVVHGLSFIDPPTSRADHPTA